MYVSILATPWFGDKTNNMFSIQNQDFHWWNNLFIKHLLLLPQSNTQYPQCDEHPKGGRGHVKHLKQIRKGGVLSTFVTKPNAKSPNACNHPHQLSAIPFIILHKEARHASFATVNGKWHCSQLTTPSETLIYLFHTCMDEIRNEKINHASSSDFNY